MMRPSRTAFTLVEILIVVVIISILATVVITMTGGVEKRVIVQEAMAGILAVKVALMDYYYSHNNQWPAGWQGVTQRLSDAPVRDTLGIRDGQLTGQHFSQNCYSVQIYGSLPRYNLWCTTTDASILDPGKTSGTIVMWGTNNTFYQNNITGSGLATEPD